MQVTTDAPTACLRNTIRSEMTGPSLLPPGTDGAGFAGTVIEVSINQGPRSEREQHGDLLRRSRQR